MSTIWWLDRPGQPKSLNHRPRVPLLQWVVSGVSLIHRLGSLPEIRGLWTEGPMTRKTLEDLVHEQIWFHTYWHSKSLLIQKSVWKVISVSRGGVHPYRVHIECSICCVLKDPTPTQRDSPDLHLSILLTLFFAIFDESIKFLLNFYFGLYFKWTWKY